MKKVIILCIIILGLIFSIECFSAELSREYQIKAGFLYKFLFFTDWPEEAFVDDEAPFTIGIFGKDPFGDIFKSIEGQPVNNRKLVVKRFEKGASAEMLRQCQLLFISSSLKADLKELLKSLKSHPVVTVSEIKEFAESGGMINFVRKKSRVGFEINKAAAKRVGIKFRSKLLRVATRVIED